MSRWDPKTPFGDYVLIIEELECGIFYKGIPPSWFTPKMAPLETPEEDDIPELVTTE
jgi:hypothetical protein